MGQRTIERLNESELRPSLERVDMGWTDYGLVQALQPLGQWPKLKHLGVNGINDQEVAQLLSSPLAKRLRSIMFHVGRDPSPIMQATFKHADDSIETLTFSADSIEGLPFGWKLTLERAASGARSRLRAEFVRPVKSAALRINALFEMLEELPRALITEVELLKPKGLGASRLRRAQLEELLEEFENLTQITEPQGPLFGPA